MNRRDWLWVLLFIFVIAVATGLPEVVVPAHPAYPADLPRQRVLLLGDSLTGQIFQPLADNMWPETRVLMRHWPGTNPVKSDWVGWLNGVDGRLDIVVFEDYTGSCCDEGGFTHAQYVAAVQAISDATHARGAKFVVLKTAVHPGLFKVTGIDARFPMAPPDNVVDGVHYNPPGAQVEADWLYWQLRATFK